jgi:hypothetical protein
VQILISAINTTRHTTVEKSSEEVVELLFGRGAEVNAKDANRRTALQLDTERGNVGIARVTDKQTVQMLLLERKYMTRGNANTSCCIPQIPLGLLACSNTQDYMNRSHSLYLIMFNMRTVHEGRFEETVIRLCRRFWLRLRFRARALFSGGRAHEAA